jgi:hypothetical protein
MVVENRQRAKPSTTAKPNISSAARTHTAQAGHTLYFADIPRISTKKLIVI